MQSALAVSTQSGLLKEMLSVTMTVYSYCNAVTFSFIPISHSKSTVQPTSALVNLIHRGKPITEDFLQLNFKNTKLTLKSNNM